MEKKYTIIDKKYLAYSLSFCGVNFTVERKGSREVYLFEDNEKFKFALANILETRRKIREF